MVRSAAWLTDLNCCPWASQPRGLFILTLQLFTLPVPAHLHIRCFCFCLTLLDSLLCLQVVYSRSPPFSLRPGHFFLVEADGRFGRDTVEILLKKDVVLYRSMAGKIVYVYPFTTPITDFDTQRKRMASLGDTLGWSLPSFFDWECKLTSCPFKVIPILCAVHMWSLWMKVCDWSVFGFMLFH